MADALSRKPLYLFNKLVTLHTRSDLEDKPKEAFYGNDEESKQTLEDIRAGNSSNFELKNDIILLNEERPQLYSPQDAPRRQSLLKEHHDSVLAGHLGMDKTYSFLSRSLRSQQVE